MTTLVRLVTLTLGLLVAPLMAEAPPAPRLGRSRSSGLNPLSRVGISSMPSGKACATMAG